MQASLYAGDLFKKSVAYAEDRGLPWFVLSARFGLWPSYAAYRAGDYDASTKSWSAYDETLANMDGAEKAAWHTKVAWDVVNLLWEQWEQGKAATHSQPRELTVEMHAGKEYAEPLSNILRSVGCNVENPLEGMQIGERLAWYKNDQVNQLAELLA